MQQHRMAEAAFFAILAAFLVTYGGYPLLILLAAAGRGRKLAPAQPAFAGSVTIIVCAHNEEAAIGPKLASVIAPCEGVSQVDLIVADDGSTDRTAALAEAAAATSPIPFTVLRLPRGGKAAALRLACGAARGEILVFTDADPLWDRQTLAALIAPFADPEVGAVAGEVRTLAERDKSGLGGGDALFRRYESAIRAAEDRLFGCVSADGGIFALRSALAEPVPSDVTDDFFLSTAAVARGRRIAFQPDARVYEVAPGDRRQHFRRRLRITVRGLTGLWRRRALMNPFRTGWYAIGLIFHKGLRRLVPVLLIPLWLLAGGLALAGEGRGYGLIFLMMTAGAALALALTLVPLQLPKPLRLPVYAAVHFAGLAAGALLFLAGRRYSQWTPQQRN